MNGHGRRRSRGIGLDAVNRVMMEKELARVRLSAARGLSYGEADWVAETVSALGLEHRGSQGGAAAERRSNFPASFCVIGVSLDVCFRRKDKR